MASPLSLMQIGSPLPDLREELGKALIEGHIEIMSTLWDLHNNSTVQLRGTKELDLDLLNGSWHYTPVYLQSHMTKLSYTIGEMQQPYEQDVGYGALLKQLCTRAEQDFYFYPLAVLRSNILNHEPKSGKTNFILPKAFYLNFNDKLQIRNVIEIVEHYVDHDRGLPIVQHLYSYIGSCGDIGECGSNVQEGNNYSIFVDGATVHRANDNFRATVDAVDLSPVFRLIRHPVGHGLNQATYQKYKQAIA